MTTARDPRVLSAEEYDLKLLGLPSFTRDALLAHNLALTERIEALERGKDEMTVRTAVAITAQDSFAGAALIAYNVLQEQHDTLAALAKLGVYENDGFRDAVRYEMAREMLKDYLPPTPPGAQP